MNKIVTLIKTHPAATFLIILLGYLVINTLGQNFFGVNLVSRDSFGVAKTQTMRAPAMDSGVALSMPYTPEAPPTETSSRMVVRDTSLSLVVSDVAKAIRAIEAIAAAQKGYLVDSNLSVPESAASGTITIRVPETSRIDTLTQIKALGLKTVSESVIGHDVTDQYVNNEARLETLNTTKTKFAAILDQAVRIQDILEVQRELINLQSQIDSLQGQQLYLEQTAKLTRIVVSLSTDEFSLPYAPSQSWRPEVIFKQAVRSFVSQLRNLGTALIWLAVYAPVWLTGLCLYWLWQRRRKTM